MSITDAKRTALIEVFMGLTAYTMPTDIDVGLWTADPGASDPPAAGEVSHGSYSRQSTDPGTDWEQVGGAGIVKNATIISFGTATGSWGTVKWFVLFDTTSGSVFICSGRLDDDYVIGNGNAVSFQIGDCVVRINAA